MAATIEICESNGVGETVTHNIANANMGDYDTPNIDPTGHAIVPGARSMAKYHRLHVTNMNGSAQIDDIRIWQSGPSGALDGVTEHGAAQHVCNLRTSGYANIAYAQPVATAVTGVDQAIPAALPNSANLGIGGDLAGVLSAIGYSDYFVHQIITGANDPSGADATLNVQYGEVL